MCDLWCGMLRCSKATKLQGYKGTISYFIFHLVYPGPFHLSPSPFHSFISCAKASPISIISLPPCSFLPCSLIETSKNKLNSTQSPILQHQHAASISPSRRKQPYSSSPGLLQPRCSTFNDYNKRTHPCNNDMACTCHRVAPQL